MEGVQAWGATLCFAAAACAAVQLLAPKNGLGRILTLIGSMVFLCCALSPLLQLNNLTAWSITSPLSPSAQNGELQDRLLRQLETPLQQAVGEKGAAALASYGLEAEKIEAVMDIGEDGGIYITEIAVTLNEKQAVRQTAVRQILKERFGTDVTVEVLK